MKKAFFQNMVFYFLSGIVLLYSCKKSNINDRPNSPSSPSKITVGQISGFAIDELGRSVEGAGVTLGGLTSITDKYGYFEISNAQVAENAGNISIAKTGYFTLTKTFVPTKSGDTFLRVMLLAKKGAGTINAATGGSLTVGAGNSGISVVIALPANALVLAASGTTYNGTASVAVQLPSTSYSRDFYRMIPGDSRCIDSTANEKMIDFSNVMFIEFSGTGGELLKIANGKTASLTLNVPGGSPFPPSNTSMWYFDDSTGFWKKGGEAVKIGNSYKGEINQTGCWNYNDIVGGKILNFDCKVLDREGHPVPNILVGVEVGGHSIYNYLYTNSSGYVKGIFPASTNTPAIFRMFNGEEPDYSQISYEKQINSQTSDLSFGTVILDAERIITLQGILDDCEFGLQNNSYIIAGPSLDLKSGDNYCFHLTEENINKFRINLSHQGGVNFPIYLVAKNNKNQQTSLPSMAYMNPGKYTLPTFEVCNLPNLEYMNYVVDSVEYTYPSYLNVGDIFSETAYFANYPPTGSPRDVISIVGKDSQSTTGMYLTFNKVASQVGSTNNYYNYIYSMNFTPSYNSTFPDHIDPAMSHVTITEYGNIGGYISGSFIAVAKEDPPSSIKHLINGNFRVKRVQ